MPQSAECIAQEGHIVTIHARFAHEVKKTPSRIAVAGEHCSRTYGEVDALANAVSSELMRRDVRRGHIVGIVGNRNPELLGVIFGILRSGAAYVYFDPEWPLQRVDFVARNAGLEVVVGTEAGALVPNDVDVISVLDVDMRSGPTHTEVTASASDQAVIVYTSGSTGTPKGIAISHRAVLARCANGYAPRPGDLQKSSLAVVAHISDCLLPILTGHRVRIVANQIVKNVARLLEQVEREGTTRLVLVPSQVDALLQGGKTTDEKLRNVDTIILSGEAPSGALVRRCLQRLPWITLVNAYGASEVCGLVTMAELRDPESITVGKPVPGSRVYILDERQQPVVHGDAGDIYLGGSQLANGYVNDPERTALAFVPDPFSNGELMYRTGDRGRINDAGELQVLGRNDGEVHLNGHRIHVSEVEAAIEKCPGVTRSVVVINKSEEPYRMEAYIQHEGMITVEQWRDDVRGRLPLYMMPSRWYPVRELPLLANGKIDRQALELSKPARTNRDPSDDHTVESGVIDICRRELANPDIDGTRHFLDSGGDSLLAVRVALEVEERFGVEVLFDELLDQPTIQHIARLVATRVALIST